METMLAQQMLHNEKKSTEEHRLPLFVLCCTDNEVIGSRVATSLMPTYGGHSCQQQALQYTPEQKQAVCPIVPCWWHGCLLHTAEDRCVAKSCPLASSPSGCTSRQTRACGHSLFSAGSRQPAGTPHRGCIWVWDKVCCS